MAKSNRALVVGVSSYRAPFSKLPAVAADVREIAKVLQSRDGEFTRSGTEVLAESKATKAAIESALATAFAAEDTAFVYLAGHGAVRGDQYYFIPYDTKASDLANTAVPLSDIKRLFDESQSERVFLWLDCCHSGGIVKRGESEDDIIARTLKVIQGAGRIIIAACSAEQYAYEDSEHGRFTGALLRGLQGQATYHGEVTATSLFDYVDREIGSDHQRPVLYGDMRGRIVLMHYGKQANKPKPKKTTPKRKTKQTVSNTVMLGDEFIDAESVKRAANGLIEVSILSHDAERDAMIQSLNPQDHFREKVPFAHRNDACDVEIKSVTGESTTKGQLWNLTLKPVDFRNSQHLQMSISDGTRTFSPEDLAELRARVILLDDRVPVSRNDYGGLSLVASTVNESSRGDPMPCPIREVYNAHKLKRSKWREFARLRAVYVLKESGTVEQVLDLTISTVRKGKVDITFKGRFGRQFSSQTPPTITVMGACSL